MMFLLKIVKLCVYFISSRSRRKRIGVFTKRHYIKKNLVMSATYSINASHTLTHTHTVLLVHPKNTHATQVHILSHTHFLVFFLSLSHFLYTLPTHYRIKHLCKLVHMDVPYNFCSVHDPKT